MPISIGVAIGVPWTQHDARGAAACDSLLLESLDFLLLENDYENGRLCLEDGVAGYWGGNYFPGRYWPDNYFA